MRRLRKCLIATAIALVVITGGGAIGFFTLTGRLPRVEIQSVDLTVHPPFRTWDEHAEIYAQGQFPYVVQVDAANGALLYVGVQHSTDPDDPQFEALRILWAQFAPTVALNEGRSRYFFFASEALGGVSDPKLTYMLAQRDGIPIYSLEPTYQDEVDALLEEWPAELVACYFSLRVIASEASGDPGRAESLAPDLIAKRTNAGGLRDTISSVSDLDRVWSEYAPDEPDWRMLSDIDSVELMRTIGDDSRETRGAHMVRALSTLVAQGERVVAVVGASHVIRHEPTVRSLLGDASSPFGESP